MIFNDLQGPPPPDVVYSGLDDMKKVRLLKNFKIKKMTSGRQVAGPASGPAARQRKELVFPQNSVLLTFSTLNFDLSLNRLIFDLSILGDRRRDRSHSRSRKGAGKKGREQQSGSKPREKFRNFSSFFL